MKPLKQLVANLFADKAAGRRRQPHDSYNQTWTLWLRHFNGDTAQLVAALQQNDSALTLSEAQALLARIREETAWAMSQFYDVRDEKQTRAQATLNIQNYLSDISKNNLNGLISYCQYSSDR